MKTEHCHKAAATSKKVEYQGKKWSKVKLKDLQSIKLMIFFNLLQRGLILSFISIVAYTVDSMSKELFHSR